MYNVYPANILINLHTKKIAVPILHFYVLGRGGGNCNSMTDNYYICRISGAALIIGYESTVTKYYFINPFDVKFW